MEDDGESFSRRLRRYRRLAELTQEGLAERAGISVRAIRAMEAGPYHRPRPDTMALLIAALDVPEEERDSFIDAARRTGL